MKLSNLTQFEALNNETIEIITGGGAVGNGSRRHDSISHDCCKKKDEFKPTAVGQA